MMIELVATGLLQGLLFASVAYGIMLPLRYLHFPDLTAEGAYPLGGAVCAVCLGANTSPLLASLAGSVSAGLLGVATSLVHLRLRVNTLLAGIIVSTMAYSVNLQIMGKPNIALFDYATLFGTDTSSNILIVGIILASCILPLTVFLRTDFGLRFRAVGLNPSFAAKQAISIDRYTMLGLFLGGCLFGLAGSLMVQMQSYMDIGMGIGIVIHGLASLMLGEAIIGNHTINRQLLAPLVGALIYQQIQGAVLALGLAPANLRFFTGSMVLLIIALQKRGDHAR